MAAPVINIRALGVKAVEKLLKQLPGVAQKKVVRQVMRRSCKHLQVHVAHNLSGHPVSPDSGRYLEAIANKPIRALPRKARFRYVTGVHFAMPTRAELGIDPKDEWYYPFVLEYGGTHSDGSTIPAKRPIRSAVDTHADEEKAFMAREIPKGIVREAKRLGKRIKAA